MDTRRRRKRAGHRRRKSAACVVSVIMPTTSWDGAFVTCARAVLHLLDTSPVAAEFIVVHDGRSPKPPEWLRRPDVRVLGTRAVGGPAAARNKAAAEARGTILFFVDADVEVAADALQRVCEVLDADDGPVAVFGAYDDAPADRGTVSRFRNLLHHHTHLTHPGPAGTFWAGCGAVRAAHFHDVGGFDEGYDRPSVEDIELGMRLRDHGGRIVLDPLLQGKHHKAWTLWSMVRTDILCRAVPWAKLIIQSRRMPASLNLDWKSRISGLLAVTGMVAAVATPFMGGAIFMAVACVAGVFGLNIGLYRTCRKSGGPVFAAAAFVLHFAFFIYSSLTFACVVGHSGLFGVRRTTPCS